MSESKPDLDVLQQEGLLAVFAVERPLRTLPLVVALLLVGSHQLFAGRTHDDGEVAGALVAGLQVIGMILLCVYRQYCSNYV